MVSKPVAIVTGASSGIGSAIAKRLARTGAMVAVHYKGNEANASEVVESIEADGGSAFAVGADVSKPGEVQALIDAVVQRCGQIDILVNNAGILEYGLFGEIGPASFERQFSTNTLSVLLMMQAAVPRFHRPEAGSSMFRRTLPIDRSKAASSTRRRRRRSARLQRASQKNSPRNTLPSTPLRPALR